MSTTIRSKHYDELFRSQETITSLVQGVVVPNISLRGKYSSSYMVSTCLDSGHLLAEHEIEQFEDDPLEFIRQDLALPSMGGGDASTRRQAAADVVRALVASGMETETTQVKLDILSHLSRR